MGWRVWGCVCVCVCVRVCVYMCVWGCVCVCVGDEDEGTCEDFVRDEPGAFVFVGHVGVEFEEGRAVDDVVDEA